MTVTWPIKKQEFMEALAASHAAGAPTKTLSEMFMLMVKKYSLRPNWIGYSYNEDMQSLALLVLSTSAWRKFDMKQDNPQPFSYFTTCIYNAFIRVHFEETEQRKIRDQELKFAGVTPSWGAQDED